MMTDPGELLLRWVSEKGAGTLSDVKQGMWWVAAKHCPDVEPGAPGRWLRDAVSLAHMDIDWRNRNWCAAPPVLTRLPHGRGLAVIAGSRTAAFDTRMAAAVKDGLLEVVPVANTRTERDIPLPPSLFVQFNSEDELVDLAVEIGVSYTRCFALDAAEVLPRLVLDAPTSVPEYGRPLEQYDFELREYKSVPRPKEDGLYRLKRRDAKRVCQVRQNGEWFETSHEYGVYAVLHQTGSVKDILRWWPEKGQGPDGVGTLYVDWGYPLPDLHRRVAVMCSGLAPLINMSAKNLEYCNVPRHVAMKIADSLGQPLTEDVDA
ncbi:hypothetical protein [Streptomyces sp. MJP52]|uniref:hypothetical protein n=1 Tax=Streptomyces sp. MJP52 TaxID=2940555 RepID=UPI002476DE02|nr:hypothetical protein [Streptomyces sp. MJP52]MDH6226804.1 hypothetical protein [Streptomyces sp. MJP52]